MSFKSFLSAVGHEAQTVFNWLASSKGQETVQVVEGATTAAVTAINPAAGAVLSGIESLVNTGLKQVVATEVMSVAAGQQSGTGIQKGAAVVSTIASEAAALLQSLGVSNPTATQVQSIAQVVAKSMTEIVNALPAPAPKAA